MKYIEIVISFIFCQTQIIKMQYFGFNFRNSLISRSITASAI